MLFILGLGVFFFFLNFCTFNINTEIHERMRNLFESFSLLGDGHGWSDEQFYFLLIIVAYNYTQSDIKNMISIIFKQGQFVLP